MPAWLTGAVRTALQAGWGYAAGWLIVHNIPVPSEAPEWVQLAVLSLIAGLVAGAVQWAERRADSPLGKVARGLARVLMLGARKAEYPAPTPESAKLLGAK